MKTLATLMIAGFGLLLVACGEKTTDTPSADPVTRDGQSLTLVIDGMT